MDDGLICCGMLSIPTGIVLSLTTPLGMKGGLAYTAGAALGIVAGQNLGSKLLYNCMESYLNERQKQIGLLASIFLSPLAGGWAAANLCGLPLTFEVAVLATVGGHTLGGSVMILLIIADEIRKLFKTIDFLCN
jgi:hypothetical protein